MHVPFPQPAQLIKAENRIWDGSFREKSNYQKTTKNQKLDFYEGDNLFVKNFAVVAKTRQLATIGSLNFTDRLRFGRVVFEKKLKTIKKGLKKKTFRGQLLFVRKNRSEPLRGETSVNMFYPLNSKSQICGVVFERSKIQKICQKINILSLPRSIFICLTQLGEPLMQVSFQQPVRLIKPENSHLGR